MKNRSFCRTGSTCILAFAATTFISGCATTFIPNDANVTCTAPDINTWFVGGSVVLNGVVNPANSVGVSPAPNCGFYQWSEHMYLWLTSPAPVTYGGGGGRVFDSPVFFDVAPADDNGYRTLIKHTPGLVRNFALRAAQVGPHHLPVIFSKRGQMFEVAPPLRLPSGNQAVINDHNDTVEVAKIIRGVKNEVIFLSKDERPIARARPVLKANLFNSPNIVQKFIMDNKVFFIDGLGNEVESEEGQAGGGGVLRAQNGSLVYYVTMVNDVYAYFLTGVKDGALPLHTNLPTTLADLDAVKTFAAAHGLASFPDSAALAVELKTSWVEAAGLADTASYIKMMATIPTYDTSNPDLWVPNGQKTVLLAMVGMHVVGTTLQHPEMVWATFEHRSNTPNDQYQYNSSSGLKTVNRTTAGNWLFCANNAPAPYNKMHAFYNSPNIQANTGQGFHITPSNTLRMKAWGSEGSNAGNNTDIISMNNFVLSTLISGDVRTNYMFTGATWTPFGSPPGSGNNGVGTNHLANTTMETYDQGDDNTAATGINCFSCHQSAPPATTAVDTSVDGLQISHIFGPIKPLF